MAWAEIDAAMLANGDRLTLRRDGDAFEIRLNLYQLMSSGNSISEQALARLTCAGCTQILIGGLGLGYTARAVLDIAAPKARVTVAEMMPQVVEWNRGPLASLAGHPLDDPRLDVVTGDVTDVVRTHPGRFDAILLDVDNGPDAVLFAGNVFLYSSDGLALLHRGLRPGGVLAVWSATPSPDFDEVLTRSGLAHRRQTVEVQDGLTHTIYLVQEGAPCPQEKGPHPEG